MLIGNRVRRQTGMLKIGMLTSGGDCQGLNAHCAV